MNCRKSPGYSLRISPSRARPMRLTLTYMPVVAHRPGHVEQHARRAPWAFLASGGSRCRPASAAPAGPAPPRSMALTNDAGDVHVRDRVAELVGLGPLRLDRPLADDRVRVPAGPRRLQLARRSSSAASTGTAGTPSASAGSPLRSCSSPCCSASSRRYSLICCCSARGSPCPRRSTNSRQLVQVDDADLGVLHRLLDLLEQLVDRLQLLLDLQRLRARSSARGR